MFSRDAAVIVFRRKLSIGRYAKHAVVQELKKKKKKKKNVHRSFD